MVERLETLAEQQGRAVVELVDEMLTQYAMQSPNQNWALLLAESMAEADSWTRLITGGLETGIIQLP